LFELGFAEQLQNILKETPAARQCLLFSATLPAQLVSFTRAGIKNPVLIRLDVETTLSDALELWFLYTRKDEKLAATVSVLRKLHQEGKQTIMFVATKHHVEFFGELLVQMGLSVAVVYGAMDQVAREEQLARFRKKKAGIMVTTDVAARGVDIPLLDHVVNFDFPPSSKLFVHRCGRTARAGRSGLAVSLVTLEDLPYTVELMLFLGRKLHCATGKPSAETSGPDGAPIIGAIPSVQHEVEALNALLGDSGTHLVSLHKSMQQSYHVYNKMRPSASRQSVTRSKQMLEECGGPSRLQGLVHPAFCENAPRVSASAQDQNFINELRGFRPRQSKVGNVISLEAMRHMDQAKSDAAVVAEVRANALGDSGQVLHTDDAKSSKAKKRRRESSKENEPESDDAEVEVKEPSDKPRVSKRRRKREGLGAGSHGGTSDFAGFDVQIDGMKVDSAPSASSKKKETKQFYLSTERNEDEEAKERGLDMEQYQFDLVPDENNDIKKAKSVIKWDAKKKKYLPVMVSADGRVVKSQKTRNESGVLVEGNPEKTGLYQKWAKATKRRIQKVGELQQNVSAPSWLAGPSGGSETGRIVDFGDDGGDGDEGGDGDRTRKPVVPFHGSIDKKHLTHKQKRMLHKREQKDRVVKGPAKQEVRSARDIMKEKKQRENNLLKQKPHLRREKAQEGKRKHREKIESRQMKNARTKSRMLIFEGPKKGKLAGKKRREGKQDRRLIGSI